MKSIKGNIFLWIPILLLSVTYLLQNIPTEFQPIIFKIIVVIYTLYNIVGVFCMLANFKGDKSPIEYYWDIDHWVTHPTREYIEETTNRTVHSYCSNQLEPFRLGSVLCWLIYFVMLIDRWFTKNLTIKL